VLRASLLLCLFSALWAGAAWAEDDFYEPAALGAGSTGRFLPLDTSVVHLSAATMSSVPTYQGGTAYHHNLRERSHTWSSAAADSTRAFALGTKYTVRRFEPPFDPARDLNWYPVDDLEVLRDKRTYHRWDVAAALPLLRRRLNIGAALRIVRQEFDIRTNRTFASLDASVVGRIPLGMGAGGTPPSLVIGLAASNLIPTRDPRFPIRLTPGVAFEMDPGWTSPFGIRAEVDVVVDFTSEASTIADLHGGAEVKIMRFGLLRAGYHSGSKFSEHFVGWGGGFQLPVPTQNGDGQVTMRLNLGMQAQVGPVTKPLRPDVGMDRQRLTWNLGLDGRYP
jgi:hypothetical protein